MLNKLNGKETGDFILQRINWGVSGEIVMLPGFSVNDDIYQPDGLEKISFYGFVVSYERVVMSFHRVIVQTSWVCQSYRWQIQFPR